MHNIVSKFIEIIKLGNKPPHITEDEVICGRIRLRAFPDLKSDDLDMLFLEFPGDLTMDEAVLPMTFKYSLAGDDLEAFLARMKKSLHSGQDHVENLNGWEIQCSERGSGRFLSIQAKVVS